MKVTFKSSWEFFQQKIILTLGFLELAIGWNYRNVAAIGITWHVNNTNPLYSDTGNSIRWNHAQSCLS